MNLNPYQNYSDYSAYSVAELSDVDARATFMKRTYLHLLGALIAFAAICGLVFALVDVGSIVKPLTRGYGMLLFLVGAMVVSYIADYWAHSTTSKAMQYLGLCVYVVAEAVFFVPLLYFAQLKGGTDLIASAGILTAVVFGGLTLTVLVTKADFSFLKHALVVGGFIAIGLVACGFILGFPLGMWFSVAMLVFASAMILYSTSNVVHDYNTEQYVAASLTLFASVTLLLWYAIRLFMHMEE